MNWRMKRIDLPQTQPRLRIAFQDNGAQNGIRKRRFPAMDDPCSFRKKRLTFAYFSPKLGRPPKSYQIAMALRPFASAASMNSRYGSQALADGLRPGRVPLSTGPSPPSESVDTSMAGFA